jgi:hypothetical protein
MFTFALRNFVMLATFYYIWYYGPVWYSFMSSFTSSFKTSIAKQPTLCPTLWSASLKTYSHRVKHMVKLQKHGSLPHSWSCSWSCFLKNSSTGEAELCQKDPKWCNVYMCPISCMHTWILFPIVYGFVWPLYIICKLKWNYYLQLCDQSDHVHETNL